MTLVSLAANPVPRGRYCIAAWAIAPAIACGPMVGTDETTTATGSTDGQTSASSSTSGVDGTQAQTTDTASTAPDTGAEDASTGEACDGTSVDGCCCFAPGERVQVEVVCSSTAICEGELQIDCTGFVSRDYFCPIEGGDVENPRMLDCILQSLANPSLGHFTVAEGGGYNGRVYTIYTTGTDQAFLSTYWFQDFGRWYDEVSRLTLPPPEFFESCQQAPTAIERYDCMRGGLTDVAEECLPL